MNYSNKQVNDQERVMGLDGVELVMRVEEEFGITIDDDEAEIIRTPGDLTDCVMAHLRADRNASSGEGADARVWTREEVLKEVIRMTSEQLAISIKKISEHSNFGDLGMN